MTEEEEKLKRECRFEFSRRRHDNYRTLEAIIDAYDKNVIDIDEIRPKVTKVIENIRKIVETEMNATFQPLPPKGSRTPVK